ncbi:MAG: glycerate kinase type-2 family protein [Candidatus Hodarchaeales archaeon]|jgi:glycerate-2-kinase
MIFQNYEEIIHYSSSIRKKPRETILKFFDTAVRAVDPFHIIFDNLTYNSEKRELIIKDKAFSTKKRKIWIIGAGKAVGRMAEALEKVLIGLEYQGVICVPKGVKQHLTLNKLHCLESTHPLPSEVNVVNTKEILVLIENIKPEDLVIALVSGGGSAIWAAPIFPINTEDLIVLNKELINSGMNIQEINVVRKHVSTIKGGKLAKIIPAEMIILILSDVIGDKLESIASGCFHPDPSRFIDARLILKQYDLLSVIPDSIKLVIEQGNDGLIPETPKIDDPIFQRVYTHVIGSNKLACDAIISNAKQLGLNALFFTDKIESNAKWWGRLLARIYCGLANGIQEPLLVISGGEPTVKVRGSGIGGRNQEVVAAVLEEFLSLPSPPDILFLSAGTDGVDGNSPYAGALVDDISVTVTHQKKLNLVKYQKENNLSKFFEKLGGSILMSGPTGTNVMDVQIAILNSSIF